jgi:hypothetical protein
LGFHFNPVKALTHAASSTVTAASSIGNVVVKTTTAPIKTVAAVGSVAIGKKSPDQALSDTGKALVSIPISMGQAVNKTTTAAQQIADIPVNATVATFGMAGKPGEYVGDFVTLGQQLSIEDSVTPFYAVGDILQGQNPLEANPATVAFAEAIETSRDQYASDAHEIPLSVKQALASQYPSDILNNARYTVVSPKVALPTFIIACELGSGSAHKYAVTVDNVIVFSEKPSHTLSGIQWWAHEMRHVQQYHEWGVLSFAYKYMLHPNYNSNPIERDAVARSVTAINYLSAHQPILDAWLRASD